MNKCLVTYFTASGNTKTVAQNIADILNADIFEIKPVIPYTRADLNWMDKKSRSSIEMNDPSSRPEIAGTISDMKNYDVIFVGFPIWWYTAPTIIKTFLESTDFSGKTIVPFATSGGSGIGNTSKDLQQVIPNAKVAEGKVLNRRISNEELEKWVKSFIK